MERFAPGFRINQSVCALTFALTFGGCTNPNAIGVQDFGSVTGRVVSSKTQAGLPALVSVGNLARQTDNQGGFVLERIPVGANQTLRVSAGGFVTRQLAVSVIKDQVSDAAIIALDPVVP